MFFYGTSYRNNACLTIFDGEQPMPSVSIISTVSLVLIGFCASFLTSCGCATPVTIPPISTTPPSVMLGVIAENKTLGVSDTSPPVNQVIQSANSTISLIGSASDDQGVKDVQVSGDVDTFCQMGNTGQLLSAFFLTDNPDNSQPGQQGCMDRLTGLNVVPSSVKCNAGFSLIGISGQFNASGSNFSNVTVSTATYSFSVAPTGLGAALTPKDLRNIPTQKPCAGPELKHLKGLKKISCTEVDLPPGALR